MQMCGYVFFWVWITEFSKVISALPQIEKLFMMTKTAVKF